MAERRIADGVLRKERDAADDVIRDERAHESAPLAEVREETDKDLSLERIRSDEAVATRDDFLGMVSHDLRNMLGIVAGFAALIADAESGQAPHDSAQVLMHARRIERSAGRMNRLIGDLVDVASIEAGALAVHRQRRDPSEVVTEVVEAFQPQAVAGGLSLVADIATGLPLTELDHARVLQVLANLVGNAIKFTPSGGHVVVHVGLAEGELRFSVRDTGVGIPSDQLEEVFERFRQVKVNDRRGSGLGLYISRCIVQGHGGRIWAESRPGEGSSFWFTLPLHRQPPRLPDLTCRKLGCFAEGK